MNTKNKSLCNVNWNQDIDSILDLLTPEISGYFEPTSYSVMKNTKKTQKCIGIFDLFDKRVAHIWPHKETKSFDICMKIDLVEAIRNKCDLPPHKDPKKERTPYWRTFQRVPLSTMLEMMYALSSALM